MEVHNGNKWKEKMFYVLASLKTLVWTMQLIPEFRKCYLVPTLYSEDFLGTGNTLGNRPDPCLHGAY